MQKKLSNKELVAAGHKFAANISADTPLIDMAKMVSELATQLDAALAAAAEAGKQRDALAADNAALKGFGDKLNDMHNKLNGEGTGIQGRAEVACQQVALEAAMDEFDTIKIPATEACLNAVRAEGVEMFAAAVRGGHAFGDRTKDLAKIFAAQLRAGNAGKDGV